MDDVVAGVESTHPHVLGEGAGEDRVLLQDHGAGLPHAAGREVAVFMAVEAHGAGLGLEKPQEHLHERGFPCAAGADDGDPLAGSDAQLGPAQDVLSAGVAHPQVVEHERAAGCAARQRWEGTGPGPVGDGHGLVEGVGDALSGGGGSGDPAGVLGQIAQGLERRLEVGDEDDEFAGADGADDDPVATEGEDAPVAEQLGASGATTVALAAATFGLVSGSLLGGPTASFLIGRHKIAPVPRAFAEPDTVVIDDEPHIVTSDSLLYAAALVAVIMAAGNALGGWFTDQFGYALPAYVGAMLIAIIVRNVLDATPVKIRMEDMDIMGNLALAFFLTQAMMTLKIWELADIAGPLAGILVVQVIVLLAFAVFVVFPVMGKDYDAATMVGGLMGHGLGATPNGIANMDAISKTHGARSKLAFVVVPLAGSVLIDIVSVPWITFCINVFA